MDILIGFAALFTIIIMIAVLPNMAGNIKAILHELRELNKYYRSLHGDNHKPE